jgi:hypothetical protein
LAYRPRWLYAHGSPDKARALLAKLHSNTEDINSPLVNIEIEEIEEKVALDGADSKKFGFLRSFSLTYIRALLGL